MESTVRAIVRVILLILWTLVMIPPVGIALLAKRHDLHGQFIQIFFRGVAGIVGVRVHVEGPYMATKPLLLVSNHSSYLDIFVLGCLFPIRFTPKSDIRSWPVIGWLTTLSQPIWVERKASKAAEQKKVLTEALQERACISIFPEGSTNDGTKLLPFKSSLFSLAEEKVNNEWLPVQPVAIAYTRINNLPVGLRWRHVYAWYGDMSFVPHFWNLLKHGSITAHLTCLPPVTMSGFASRKEMASYCHDIVAEKLEKMVRHYA